MRPHLVLAFFFLFGLSPAHAETCPTPQPCRVLTLTPDEEQALTGAKMILDTAEQGRPLDLLGAVKYFRDKIANAPRGTPPESTPAKP